MWGSGETRGILDEILPYCRLECQEMPLMVAPTLRNQILAAMDCSGPECTVANNLFHKLRFLSTNDRNVDFWDFQLDPTKYLESGILQCRDLVNLHLVLFEWNFRESLNQTIATKNSSLLYSKLKQLNIILQKLPITCSYKDNYQLALFVPSG